MVTKKKFVAKFSEYSPIYLVHVKILIGDMPLGCPISSFTNSKNNTQTQNLPPEDFSGLCHKACEKFTTAD